MAPMSKSPTKKLLLITDSGAQGDERGAVAVRRFRLARLRFDALPPEGPERFEHLKRTYD